MTDRLRSDYSGEHVFYNTVAHNRHADRKFGLLCDGPDDNVTDCWFRSPQHLLETLPFLSHGKLRAQRTNKTQNLLPGWICKVDGEPVRLALYGARHHIVDAMQIARGQFSQGGEGLKRRNRAFQLRINRCQYCARPFRRAAAEVGSLFLRRPINHENGEREEQQRR
jgi:hypothetical protein